MNTQTIKQEDLRRAMAKQTLGLPLTGRENSLITLFGQSSTYERENKPVFVEKYLKPLVVALQIGIANVVYRKSDKYDEIVTLIYENGYTTDVSVTADSLSAIVRDVMTGL
jgi:hypothetical protein